MTELRDFGDGQTVVVYTNNRDLASKLGNLKICLDIVPYEQEQYKNKRIALIGIDYYFPKKRLRGLFRTLGIPTQPLKPLGVIQIGS